jgi:hypothetical protein
MSDRLQEFATDVLRPMKPQITRPMTPQIERPMRPQPDLGRWRREPLRPIRDVRAPRVPFTMSTARFSYSKQAATYALAPVAHWASGTLSASGHVTGARPVQDQRLAGSVEMEAIKEFPAPPLCKKLIHRYRDRQRLPDVRIVEG